MGSDMHMMSKEERAWLSIDANQSCVKDNIQKYSKKYNNGTKSKSIYVGHHWLSKSDRGKNKLPLALILFYCMTLEELDSIIRFQNSADNIDFNTCKHSKFLEAMTLNFGRFSIKIKKDKYKFRINSESFDLSPVLQFYFQKPIDMPTIINGQKWQKFDFGLFMSRVKEISTR